MKICLVMIVRNESHVVRRCLDSVRALVDYWVVVDTGSTDDTVTVVNDAMRGVPGTMASAPWVDFATNRNGALALAMRVSGCSHALVVDADDFLEVTEGPPMEEESADCLELEVSLGSLRYWRPHIFRLGAYRYEGVVHEALVYTGQSEVRKKWKWWEYRCRRDGARSKDPEKYEKDSEILRKELAKNPRHSRYQFYLAQSLRDAGDRLGAIREYRKCVDLKGWGEEVYISLLRIAQLSEADGLNAALPAYWEAHNANPNRAEAITYLAMLLRRLGRLRDAYPLAKMASNVKMPPEGTLFVDVNVYDWQALDELCISAYYAGAFHDAAIAGHILLAQRLFPPEEKTRIETNTQFADDALARSGAIGVGIVTPLSLGR